eukprot:Em0012g239a
MAAKKGSRTSLAANAQNDDEMEDEVYLLRQRVRLLEGRVQELEKEFEKSKQQMPASTCIQQRVLQDVFEQFSKQLAEVLQSKMWSELEPEFQKSLADSVQENLGLHGYPAASNKQINKRVKQSNPQLFCKIDTLVDFHSFLLLVPGSQCFIPNGIDIIFDSVVVPVSSIFAFCEKPAKLIRWIATTSSFARFDTQMTQVVTRVRNGVNLSAGIYYLVVCQGFQDKVHGNVCNHFKSFVGRDFKAWAQMAIFILSPYLSSEECEVLLSCKKVFRIAYCCHFKLSDAEEWQQLCEEFVKNVKDYMPALLKKQKVHTILHLVECMISYGPSSAFSAERCGSGLQELYKSMQVQQFLNFVLMKELNKGRIIYKPGSARKFKYGELLTILKLDTTGDTVFTTGLHASPGKWNSQAE